MSGFETHLIGKSAEFMRVFHPARVVAATDVTVLILGESGTGKELMAQAVHDTGRRSEHPFVALNCAAIPESLIESELFGHRKGAFTGAMMDCTGHVQSARGGTLFLDEVGELPLPAQAKLLRFLETREVQAVGARTADKVDVRIIAATNSDLYGAVKAGRFREDLYYRLNVVPLELPPLRERRGDVPLLLDHFTKELSGKYGLQAPRYTRSVSKMLEAHSWPGNVRELRNFCERMVVLFSGRDVQVTNLPQEILHADTGRGNSGFALPPTGINLSELEMDIIRQALKLATGNRSRAARLLGISRDTLLYRIQKYAIEA